MNQDDCLNLLLTLASAQGVAPVFIPEYLIPCVECFDPENSAQDNRQVLNYIGFCSLLPLVKDLAEDSGKDMLVYLESHFERASNPSPLPAHIFKDPKNAYVLSKILRNQEAKSTLRESLNAYSCGNFKLFSDQAALIPKELRFVENEFVSVEDIVKYLGEHCQAWASKYLNV